MIIKEYRQRLAKELEPLLGAQEAWSVTGMILEHFGYPQESILSDPNQPVETNLRSEIKKIVQELHKNRPIQYVLGKAFFCELELYVNESVLIPRPETEELVAMVKAANTFQHPRIIDIGTGSGCIAIALSLNIEGAELLGTDISQDAIEIAKKNSMHYNAGVSFMLHSIFDPLPKDSEGEFDILVSNPPYVTEQEKALMQANVLENEPHQALFVDNEAPLLFYEAIIKQSQYLLGKQGEIWVEINEKFGKETAALFLSAGFSKAKIIKDIHDKERFIYAKK